ncbi:hypothetical protein HQ305_01455 [Rhodococcus sp. BP-149]|uniref:hypothetical protein n=1 Tax=unclassified Rhodococcus (in: high G+C Gram-positive bacteria) TaxID=192944 RepID=UPI001C9BAD08|nr:MULTISPECIES: hypothetical protein [unclassified Rhodococcus (in: high G+C Gram-positive bacteria)]MBY6684915.1 hypothetical protein [Rhodococcus sp. BP-288]MBY6692601.1 hypothetical protein [Rhodococcus sp. BP-188]MBY6698499.1 hypothetical protein [Rhodococcus sp. BP-285]MBY6701178.1 hypothetical protein [Rhodococcus sp. BP-283]MBY6712179.1 hypothetical protein [Rhodococcus sp. BP-160]
MRVVLSRRRALAASVVAFSLLLSAPVPASAQEESDSAPVSTPLSFGALGLGGSIALSGQRGSAVVTLPVPPGTVPTSLRGIIEVPAGIERGWLDISHRDRIVGRVDLPTGVPTAPVDIPLTGLDVVDDTVTLQMTTTMVPSAGYCLDTRESSTVRLQDPVMDVVGTPANPTVVADFLPPVLSGLRIFVPDEPTADQSTAALTLATSVVDYYGSQPVRVTVVPASSLGGAAPDGPFDRSVVLTPNTDPDARLIYPTTPGAPPQLFVAGDGTTLVDQIALLTSDVSALAVSTRVSAGAVPERPTLSSDSMTLADMSLGPLTASGPGEVTVTIPVDQTRLGRAASDLRVHVLGDYTPLSSEIAGALRISIGASDLVTWPADETGKIDQWVDVPSGLVDRVTSLDVVMQTSGNGDTCSTGGSLTVTVAGGTTIESAAGTPAARGFASIPQALMPTVDVALAQQDLPNTVRAATMLTGLQRLSARALAPAVVPVEQLLDGSGPGLLVAPDGIEDLGVDTDLALPLATTGTSILTLRDAAAADDGAQVTVDSDVPFASVQVARDGDRTLLVATASDPDQLDGLVAWLGEDPTRWEGLTGDVVLGAGDREPVSLSSSADVPETEPVAAGSTAPSGVVAILIAGLVAVLVGVVAAILVFVRSRGRQDEVPPVRTDSSGGESEAP